MTKQSYRTVIFYVKAHGDLSRKIVLTAERWRQAFELGLVKLKKLGYYPSMKKIDELCYSDAYRLLGCSYYATTVCRELGELIRSCKALGVKLQDVELSNWLLIESKGDSHHRGNGGIHLDSLTQCTLFLIDKGESRARKYTISNIKPPRSSRFKAMVEELIALANEGKLSYNARLYILGIAPHAVYAQLQVSVPYDLYMKYARRVDREIPLNKVKYVLGFDVNSDNIAWCLIDKHANLIDWGVIDFRAYRTQGAPGKVCRAFIMKQLHILFTRFVVNESLELAVAVEDKEVLCKLKLVWIRSGERKHPHYNYWVSVFRPRLIDDIEQIAAEYGVYTVHVEPKGTTRSEEHDVAMRQYRVNRHVASAYIIAKRALTYIN